MKANNKKQCTIILTVLLAAICLSGCGHKIYKSDAFSASVDKSADVLNVSLYAADPSIPDADIEDLKEKIGRVEEDEVFLADHRAFTTYTQVFDMSEGESRKKEGYQMFSDSLSDMERILGLDFLESTEADPAPDEVNFYLHADEDMSRITIYGTTFSCGNLDIQSEIVVHTIPSGTLSPSIFTDNNDFTHYISEDGLDAHILIGNNQKEAYVFLNHQNILYKYDIFSQDNITSEAVNSFIRSLKL